jgi:hypothetical protein
LIFDKVGKWVEDEPDETLFKETDKWMQDPGLNTKCPITLENRAQKRRSET